MIAKSNIRSFIVSKTALKGQREIKYQCNIILVNWAFQGEKNGLNKNPGVTKIWNLKKIWKKI